MEKKTVGLSGVSHAKLYAWIILRTSNTAVRYAVFFIGFNGHSQEPNVLVADQERRMQNTYPYGEMQGSYASQAVLLPG
jgi:hypothetical protein